MAGVLVVTESKDGKLKKVSREALTIGRKLGEVSAFATDRAVAKDTGARRSTLPISATTRRDLHRGGR